MLRKVAAKVAWVGRTASMVSGLALVLALVVGGATMAFAADPGDPLELGQANNINALTRLTGTVNSTMLRITNNSTNDSATALDLQVEPGSAPMEVDSDVKVASLNADEVDGESADEIGVNGWERVEATSAFNSLSPKTVTARCPARKVVVGTGADIHGGKETFNQDILANVIIDEIIPSESSLSVSVRAYEESDIDYRFDYDWKVTAYAICATAPSRRLLAPTYAASLSQQAP
jgi:hypothetical protein